MIVKNYLSTQMLCYTHMVTITGKMSFMVGGIFSYLYIFVLGISI